MTKIYLGQIKALRRFISVVEDLTLFIQNSPCPVVIISSEVGHGIVPTSSLAREFRDMHGILNQKMAKICPNVILASCGLPLALKGKIPAVLQ